MGSVDAAGSVSSNPDRLFRHGRLVVDIMHLDWQQSTQIGARIEELNLLLCCVSYRLPPTVPLSHSDFWMFCNLGAEDGCLLSNSSARKVLPPNAFQSSPSFAITTICLIERHSRVRWGVSRRVLDSCGNGMVRNGWRRPQMSRRGWY
eukprot:scaffold229607_cov27-Attheya_sp.AAC.1